MNPDVLERLATDRALGNLSPDVEHLLEAYLGVDAESHATAGEIGRTVALAREALAERQPSSMPAFPVAGFQQIERWRRRVRGFTYAAGLAACLMIGVGLGRTTVPGGGTDAGQAQTMLAAGNGLKSTTVQESRDVPAMVRSAMPSERDGEGFWSVERLRQLRESERLQSPNSPDRDIQIQWPFWNRPT